MSNIVTYVELSPEEKLAIKLRNRKVMNALAGFAVRIDPIDLSPFTYGSLNGMDVGYRASNRVLELYNGSIDDPLSDDDAAYFLLKNGIAEVSSIVHKSLGRIPHPLSFEQALSVVRHPDTEEEVALLASRPAKGVDGLEALIEDVGDSYLLSPDHTSIMTGPSVFAKKNGCPAAGDPSTGEVNPTPLFRKFVVWSGELSLRALQYADHDR